ncbi:FxsA family protein [Thiomicrorhabdus sediminis]|uniref:FxsA family protein n=1 Tax=Thiomicrorhabdus sediminis TaxID=2580412 RepID=A0A4P9K8J8_9GAMM|nr:FxsA family protein [Thiomicrorhabdus sediminis]QCU90736.1 FxsA family protein [Thiomicrorhabdus sediminis]
MRILFLLLFVVPLIELYFLIQVGSWIGALPTVLLTIATAVIGVFLMRSQGLATLQTAQTQMAQGESPQATLMHGVLIFLGGVMLFFPGLISDTIGLLLLIPLVRNLLIKVSAKGMKTQGYYRYQQDDNIYEGQWHEKEPQAPKNLQHDDKPVIDADFEDKDKR